MSRRGAGSDRGSATVWTAVAMAAVGVVFGAVLAMAQAVEARHRAGSAADLAALAAADHWTEGRTRACALAVRVARAQGAGVVRCALHGEVSDVTAVAGARGFRSEVRSRAGPPSAGVPTPGLGPP
ncbi:Rv3654c family TadE-like protein [Streptomyces sp. BYX5S]